MLVKCATAAHTHPHALVAATPPAMPAAPAAPERPKGPITPKRPAFMDRGYTEAANGLASPAFTRDIDPMEQLVIRSNSS